MMEPRIRLVDLVAQFSSRHTTKGEIQYCCVSVVEIRAYTGTESTRRSEPRARVFSCESEIPLSIVQSVVPVKEPYNKATVYCP